MTTSQKKLALKLSAGVVIVAVIVGVLLIVRAMPIVAVGLVALGLLVLLAFKIRANRKTKVIFGFYSAAN